MLDSSIKQQVAPVMDQLELFDIANPCIGVCQSNNRGYCLGCLRSRDERFNWHLKPVSEQAHILRLLVLRRARLKQRQQKEEATDVAPITLELF